MALILTPEDGTGLAGANSYASLADLVAYLEAHLYPGTAATAVQGRREAALVMATRVINSQLEFDGTPYSAEQGTEWPRAGRELPWVVPQRLKDATCELAIDLMNQNRLAEPDQQGIASLGLGQGAIDLKFDAADSKKPLPGLVRDLLAPFGRLRGGRGMTPTRRGY
jgi:hypothetical protein